MNIRNKLKLCKLSDIQPYTKNAKIHTQEQIELIKKSLNDYEYYAPISVDSNNICVCGHGRLEALKQIDPNQDIEVVDLSYLKPKAIQKLRILDNKIVSTDYDKDLLQAEIESIYGDTEKDINNIVGELNVNLNDFINNDKENDPEKEWEGMPEFNQEDKEALQSLHIHFKTKKDIDDFANLIKQKITEKTRSIWFPFIEIERYADKRYE